MIKPQDLKETYWDVVKEDIFEAVCHFAASGSLPIQWKSNSIALIPKVANPQTLEEFRPISLCNVADKIVSKLLTNLLKPFFT